MTPSFATQKQHRKYITSYSDAIHAIVDDVKQGSGKDITEKEAKLMHKGISDFSGEDYYYIRKAYQNPKASQYDRERMAALDSYLKAAPKWDGQIYRGINVPWNVANEILSKPEVDMQGPSSWSSEPAVAEGFASRGDHAVSMVFVLKENKSGASITHIASYDGVESEVTAPSGVKYVIDSVKQSTVSGLPWIHVYVSEKA